MAKENIKIRQNQHIVILDRLACFFLEVYLHFKLPPVTPEMVSVLASLHFLSGSIELGLERKECRRFLEMLSLIPMMSGTEMKMYTKSTSTITSHHYAVCS